MSLLFFPHINVISLNLVEVFSLSMICPNLARAIHSIRLMASRKISQTIWFIEFQICQNPSLAPRPSSKIAASCILLPYFSQPWFWISKLVNKMFMSVWVCVKLLQACLTLRDPMDCSPPGSSVHRILQARVLEWVAISSSRKSSQPRDRTHVSCISCIDRKVLYH